MTKPEWGIKRTCQSCKALFYDMRKDPIVCPKCKTVFDMSALLAPNPIDGTAKSKESHKDIENESQDYEFEDDIFLDKQEDFMESLEDLEELEDRLEPNQILPHNA